MPINIGLSGCATSSTSGVQMVGVSDPIVNVGSALAPIIDILPASPTQEGSMSAADKTKLDALDFIRVKEIDGAPNVYPVLEIQVANGTLTDLGGGVVQLTTGGGGTLRVRELDGVPNVFPVTDIVVSNGTLTDLGGGVVQLTTGAVNPAWELLGNAATNPLVNFIGTTDDQDLVLKVNGSQAVLIDSNALGYNNWMGGDVTDVITAPVQGSFIGWGVGNTILAGDYAVIVGGRQNILTGLRGFIGGGFQNTLSGTNAVLVGGYLNSVTNDHAALVGGESNIASGLHSAVVGGKTNSATNAYSIVGGGILNQATGVAAAVFGGNTNVASGAAATIAGGAGHVASGDESFIGGGNTNLVDSLRALVAGGASNTATANYAAVVGGFENDATALYSFIGGGQGNTASGAHSTVAGGNGNTASLDFASVGGGDTSLADAFYSTVAGGRLNHASGTAAFIGGGQSHLASGDYSTVAGGNDSTASGDYSTVAGGNQNTVSGLQSSVVGGQLNQVVGDNSVVSGGSGNLVNGNLSAVVGGSNHVIDGNNSTVLGGDLNTIKPDWGLSWGRRAVVDTGDTGAMVFADSSDFDFASVVSNELAVRATGGVRLVTAIDVGGAPTFGAQLDGLGHLKVGTAGAAATSAVIDADVTDGAVLFPRLTTAQRNALTPAAGMMIYNTTTSQFEVYIVAWSAIGAGAPGGKVTLGWYIDATAAVGDGQGPILRLDRNVTLDGMDLSIKTAPTGQALIVDVDYATVDANGPWSTIFTTRPEIVAGAVSGGGGALLLVTSLSAGNWIRFNIDQVGSGVAGAGLSAQLKMTEA